MKSLFLGLLCTLSTSILLTSVLAAQATPVTEADESRTGVDPLVGVSRSTLLRQSATGATIPLWSYAVTSPVDSNAYSGTMVGRSPFAHGHKITTVPIYLIPVILTFASDGTVFDPTVSNSCIGGHNILDLVQHSPVFLKNTFVMNGLGVGNRQYVDAFQRANFWEHVDGTPYGVELALTTLPAVQVTVPSANGSTVVNNCGKQGRMQIAWWRTYLTGTLIPSLAAQGVTPTTFPLFLLSSVIESLPAGGFFAGVHGASTNADGIVQTYAWSEFDASRLTTNDVGTVSHEVGEWMNDPIGGNSAPAWGNIGQVVGCQADVEVGDPLTGTFLPAVQMPNGYSYHLQELAFFSWFFRQVPSIGAGGYFSNNRSFLSDAGTVCH